MVIKGLPWVQGRGSRAVVRAAPGGVESRWPCKGQAFSMAAAASGSEGSALWVPLLKLWRQPHLDHHAIAPP